MVLRAEEIAAACGGRIIAGNGDAVSEHVSLNSREMRGSDLFVPVIGERVDAHRFLADAFQNGASCAFTSEHRSWEDVLADPALASLYTENGSSVREAFPSSGKTGQRPPQADTFSASKTAACGDEPAPKAARKPALIQVPDTGEALRRLGQWYRKERVSIPLIGVTGSVGKTTTREMTACALSADKRVYATKKNFNSQLGVPITILEADPSAEIGVVELGMSNFGEMHRISEVARVDAAVFTNIGVSHINQLGSQENIRKEKLHILDGMPDGAPLFLNGDDPLLRELTEEKIHSLGIAAGKRIPIFYYGTGDNADYRVTEVKAENGGTSFFLHSPSGKTASVRLSQPGLHRVLDAAAAVAAASFFGTDLQAAADALARFASVSGRGEIREKDGLRVIDDSYNAAPASMKAGLSVLAGYVGKGRLIAVLADMLELGENEKEYHREVGRAIASDALPIDFLYLYGPMSAEIARGIAPDALERGEAMLAGGHRIRIFHDLDKKALSARLRENLKSGDTVLLKGSNTMGLSELAKELL